MNNPPYTRFDNSSLKPDGNSDEIYREVLGIYGLVRMTVQVRRRFEEAEKA